MVLPLEEFQTVGTNLLNFGGLEWGCTQLPAYIYQAEAEDILVELRLQKVFKVNNTIQETNDMSWFLGPSTRFDTVPKPNAGFSDVFWNQFTSCTYVGNPADKHTITHLGISVAPMDDGQERPNLRFAGKGSSSGSSTTGEDWASLGLESNWGPEVPVSGGGTNKAFDKSSFDLPCSYAADLYINGPPRAELTLLPVEGGAQ